MVISEVIDALVVLLGGVISIGLFALAFKILFANKADYEINRERSNSIVSVVRGNIRTKHGEHRDFRVQAGLAVDKKKNEWAENGALSEESIDSVIG